jgi:quercetin dioxygenase-like cupin family protein
MPTMRLLQVAAIFGAGVLTGALALAAALPPAPRMSAKVLLSVVSDELHWKRTQVRVNLDTWEPGSETGRHEHPGPGLLYVLEGELEEVRADASTRPLRTGEAVWNRGRNPHNVRNRSDRVARALAVHLDPGR